MLVAFSVWPSGGPRSDSGHDAIAAAVRVVRASGLPNRTDAMFTTIEGEWGEVFDVIHRATDAVLAYGTRVDLGNDGMGIAHVGVTMRNEIVQFENVRQQPFLARHSMDDHQLAVTSGGSRLTRVIWLTCLGCAFAIGAATTGVAHPGRVVATVAGVGSVLLGIAMFDIDLWPSKLLRGVVLVASTMLFASVGLLLRTLLQSVLARVG